jgi:hypothetical protein
VSGIDEMHLGVRIIALKGFGAGRQEERIVLALHREKRGPSGADARGVAPHQGGRRLSVACRAFHGLLSTCGRSLHGQNAGLGGRVLSIALTKKDDNGRP